MEVDERDISLSRVGLTLWERVRIDPAEHQGEDAEGDS